MDHTNPESIKKQLRTMIMVFIGLLFLTIVTVAASYLHMSVVPAIILALFIASIKAGLVAAYFMHLIDEKKLVYWVMILCVVFFVVMLALPTWQYFDDIVAW